MFPLQLQLKTHQNFSLIYKVQKTRLYNYPERGYLVYLLSVPLVTVTGELIPSPTLISTDTSEYNSLTYETN